MLLDLTRMLKIYENSHFGSSHFGSRGAFTPAFPPGRMVPARALPGAAEEEPAPL